MYRLPCSCGQEHLVETVQAGQSIRCRCGKDLEVPTMQGLRRLVRVEASEPVSPPGRSWGLRHRLLLIGAILAVIGGALLAYVAIQRPRYRDIDTLSPYQTLLLWDTYSRGVGDYTGEERAFFEVLRQNNQRLVATGAVAALGALVMLGDLAVRAPAPQAKRKRR
jgi:hypothetical protein